MELNKWRFGRGCSFSCWGDSQVSSLEKNSSRNLVMSTVLVSDPCPVGLGDVGSRMIEFLSPFEISGPSTEDLLFLPECFSSIGWEVSHSGHSSMSTQENAKQRLYSRALQYVWHLSHGDLVVFVKKATTKLMFSMMRMASVSWYCPATNHDVLSPLLIWWMMDTAGFQTMEHIPRMPSTKNRGSGKWPFLEVYTLSKPNPLKRGLPPPPKKKLPTPIVQGQSVSFRERTEGSAFLTCNDSISKVETMCLSQPGGCLLYRSLTIEAHNCGKEPMFSVSDVKYDESVRSDYLEEVGLSIVVCLLREVCSTT